MTTITKWSEEAWKAAEPIYQAILKLPFVRELAAGTLDRKTFDRYIGQDSLYLSVYSRILAHISSRGLSEDMTETFLRFAQDGVAVEKILHSTFVKDKPTSMSPACRFYTAVLSAQMQEPIEVETAAILPCFWVYQKVGMEIVRSAEKQNPYSSWIATYSDKAFEESTRKATEICDMLAEQTSSAVREQMTQIFVECTRMEWLFWHGAYENLKWEL